MLAEVAACAALLAWAGLLCARGGFWRAATREEEGAGAARLAPGPAPATIAVIPARDEAPLIGQAVTALLRQDYPGSFRIVVVDDGSSDGTAAAARAAAEAAGAADRVTVLAGAPLPAGWTGKLWAVAQGVEHALRGPDPPVYLLLTDADIACAPGALARAVARAEHGGLVLVSLMAKLRCESPAERWFVPAFVYFFQMLYPFAWVNRPDRRTAAAAGGFMLVRAQTLLQAGGIAGIRGALIDDCALAARLKPLGPIWLGLSGGGVRSLRPYPCAGDFRRMVRRTAYTQLDRDPLNLAGALAGMAVTWLAPPLLALFAGGFAQLAGLVAWAAMALSFQPMLRYYGRSPFWGVALPAIAAAYMLWTLDSALQHAAGRGGTWKGRSQAGLPEAS